jgi:hypothetical protein
MVAMTWMMAHGQQSNTFYLMHQVPQSNLLNPAVQLRCKWYVGIPALASGHVSYSNTAFTYNDIAGSDTWNLGVVDQMHRRDLYSAEAVFQLVSIGYRHKLTYFTFNIAERSNLYSVVPKELAVIAVNGNGPLVGEITRFRAFRPAGYYQREYSLGVSRVIDRTLTVGARAKLIFGKAGMYPGSSNLQFHTNESNFNLLLQGDYTMNISLPLIISQDADGNISGVSLEDLNYPELLLNRGNPGMGIDLGILYHPDDRITLAASLLDMGFVRWRTDLNTVRTEGTFDFRGVDAGTDVVSFDYLEEMIDSLRNSFTEVVIHQPYFSSAPAQLFLAGSYQFKEHMSVGLVNRNVLFRNKVHSSFSVIYQIELASRFLATASWSYLNNSLLNLGAGVAYYGAGMQFHVVTDNLMGFFFPFDTRTLNLRVGINLMLGCPRNRKELLESESYGRMPDPENCGMPSNPGRREKKMERAARRYNRK